MKDNRTDNLGPLYRRMTGSSECLPADALVDVAAGRAWPWQRRRVVAHLAECPHCADDYRAVRGVRDDMLGALDELAPASRRGLPPVWGGAAFAAAAALVAVLGVSVLIDRDTAGPAADEPVLFAAEFEPAEPRHAAGETLFSSDFDNGSRAHEG